MAIHQKDPNALALWQYFQSVVTWVQATFKVKRTKLMKGIEWGVLYNQFGQEILNADEIEKQITTLIADDEVVNKKGIYFYVLTQNEKYLSLRTFSDGQKQKIYEQQNGICRICNQHFKMSEMEADHIIAWSKGGKTDLQNCQMLCQSCNRSKSDN